MLIAIKLHLKSDEPVRLPPFVGRANYAATLARLSAFNPDLVQQLHDAGSAKPLTCSSVLNVRGNRDGMSIAPDAEIFVRITGLETGVSSALQRVLVDDPPKHWTLDGHDFAVTGVTCDEAADPWTGTSTYETLAARQLTATDEQSKRTLLRFAAPTAFKSAGKTVPIPLPGLVFGSLVERWNSFSPVTLSPEMRRFGEEMVAISRYRLSSRPVVQKNGALRMGGVGDVTYTALGGDRYWRGVMQMLADYVRFSGVGVQTTTGMGQCRRVDVGTREP